MTQIESIEVINRSILICTFLIGFVSGGAIAVIVAALKERRRDD